MSENHLFDGAFVIFRTSEGSGCCSGENGCNVLYTKNNKSITELLADRLQLPVTSGDTLIDYSIARNGENGNPGLQESVGENGKKNYVFVKKRAGNSPDFDAEWAYILRTL